MLYRVIDFEASGEKPDGEVIEVGWCDLRDDGTISDPVSILVKPTRPISVETIAVHHLRESDLAGGVTRDEAFAALNIPEEACDLFGYPYAAYVAHSAKFEQEWFPEATIPWICTYKCALKLWPESPKHSNQVLRYFLGLDLPPHLAMPPHRAGPDAYVTANILRKTLERATFEELVQWSSEPALLPRVNFGRHRGMAWSDVDDGFLHWVLGKDFDEDVVHTVKTELARRESAYRMDEEEVPA